MKRSGFVAGLSVFLCLPASVPVRGATPGPDGPPTPAAIPLRVHVSPDGRVFDAESALYDARWLPLLPGMNGGIIPQQFG